jgi:hypothetical protein
MFKTEEKKNQCKKKWILNHKENINVSQKKYYENNKDKINQRNKKWNQENRKQLNIYSHSSLCYKCSKKNKTCVQLKVIIIKNKLTLDSFNCLHLIGTTNGTKYVGACNISGKENILKIFNENKIIILQRLKNKLLKKNIIINNMEELENETNNII